MEITRSIINQAIMDAGIYLAPEVNNRLIENIKIAIKELEGNKNDNKHNVINCPSELEPVLAQIEHQNSLGKSKWYEVVYFHGNWQCYSGSKTFKDGEKVIDWEYCKDCL